ncbi:MAG: choice-of-anchor B family protein [Gemmatimonadota bacterium]|nr:choice-of-anchor B family protein [Gemmatimonadota bacterium]MDH3427297.1 choice-of-anchor B family protein [Gemmatimonadota bacterium]
MTMHRTMACALFTALFTMVGAAPAFAQAYGYRAAVAGDELVVTEPLNSTTPGAVYVYRRDSSGEWVQSAQLLASDASANDFFGRSLAVDGSTMFIGATVKDNSTGAMYRFERGADGAWTEVERFRPEDLAEGESFGRMAAMSGDLAVFAAWGHAEGRGGAWVYERDGRGAWNRTARLTASDGAQQDFFGYSLATDGNVIAVGAALRDRVQDDGEAADAEADEAAGDGAETAEPETEPDVGAVYIFERDADGEWQESVVEVPWLESNALFGWSVAVLAGDVLAGAPGESGFTGTVYRLTKGDDGWSVSQALQAFDGAPGSWFGSAVGVADGAVWVGSQGADQGAGATYMLAYDGDSAITGISKLEASNLEQGDNLGTFLTVSGGTAVVTAGGSDYGLGAVRVFASAGGEWAESGELFTEAATPYEPITGGKVDCSEGEAGGFGCKDVDVLSFLPLQAIGAGRGVTTNDVWGWTDPETGHEYALVGMTDATSFIDVTDAVNPVYVGKLDRTPGAPGSGWRDIKVYQNHAFIVSEAGGHGVQVFDLTELRDFQGAPIEFGQTAHYDGVSSAHNIVINEQSGFAFSVGSGGGGETCGGGLHMIDVRTPAQPSFAGCFSDPKTGNAGTGYSHDAQCVIYEGPDADYRGREICIGSNETAISVADVTDKANPIAITSATYPTVGYAHQGWFTEDQRYFFMNDEGDETNQELGLTATRTLIWDMQDLDDPILVKEHLGETLTIDHNLYIKGDLMYQSNYVSGLRILDVSDPVNPVEVGFFDTVPDNESVVFDGSWSNYPFFESGTIVVTSGSQGVFMLQKRDSDPVT